jgi:hypothetical protein
MVGIGVKVFFMEICQNCTVVTIETSPTNTAISGRSHKYWYAVPYPSSFHWWEGIKELPWEVNSITTARRDILSLFIGSVKTWNANSNSLRRTLYTHCNADKECQWHNTAHACNGVRNYTHVLSGVLRLFGELLMKLSFRFLDKIQNVTPFNSVQL